MDYYVQRGDTLGSISKRFYGTSKKYKTIVEANGIVNPNHVSVGTRLIIPEQSTLTVDMLKHITPKTPLRTIQKYVLVLNDAMEDSDINTPLRKAHFLAQLCHESCGFKYTKEGLNYSKGALLKVFGKYFNKSNVSCYARNPAAIANRAYGGRLGNGSEYTGDGWRYRGRGLIQLTGKSNYISFGAYCGRDCVTHPEIVSDDPYLAVLSACWYWSSRNLNRYADSDNVREVTRRINGGYNGLGDRIKYLKRAKKVFNI